MKKIKFFALAALLMGSTSVFAQTPSDGTWKYNVTNAGLKQAELVSLVDSKKGTVETLNIPEKVTGEGGVEYSIISIAAGAFEGDEKIKTVKFTTAITAIGDNAFKDASSITTVTFPEGSKLAAIGNGAFANTFALEKIDLSNTQVFYLGGCTPFVETIYHDAVEAADATFEETTVAEADWEATVAAADPGTYVIGDEYTVGTWVLDGDVYKQVKTAKRNAADAYISYGSSNVALEEIVLAAKTQTIGIALAKLRALKKVNIGATKIRTIEPYAFDGDKNLTELVLPAVYLYDTETGEQLDEPQSNILKPDALAGSSIQKLTINGMLKTGEDEGIGATGATTLTEITFNGEVQTGAIKAGAFAGNLKLAKVSFNGKVNAGAIVDGSFTGCATSTDEVTGAKSLAFSIAAGKADAVVFAAADGDETASAGLKAFSNTQVATDAQKNVAISAPDAAVGETPYRATFKATVAPAKEVKVYGTSTFYGKYMNTGDVAVNIKREVATVYSAYVDGSKLYMDPLQVVDGNQIIAAGQAVIVKTSSPKEAADKSYNYVELAALPGADDMPANGHTMRLSGVVEDPIVNDIQWLAFGPTASPNYKLAADLKDDNPTKVLYVVGDLTKGLKWQTPKDNVKLYNNTLYVFADEETESGRLEIIWLDGSEEEATAIKSVKSAKAENGAIYNLAGQKVNAAYKGVVIKDGKKYIQK